MRARPELIQQIVRDHEIRIRLFEPPLIDGQMGSLRRVAAR